MVGARPVFGGGPVTHKQRWAGRPEGRGCGLWKARSCLQKGEMEGPLPAQMDRRERLTGEFLAADVGLEGGEVHLELVRPHPAPGGLSHCRLWTCTLRPVEPILMPRPPPIPPGHGQPVRTCARDTAPRATRAPPGAGLPAHSAVRAACPRPQELGSGAEGGVQ